MLVVSKKCFTFVKSNEKWEKSPKIDLISMKDRIRQVMESLHLTQQEFAERTQIGAATLSNIFNDRTRPTLNVVELLKKNIPNLSTDWLLLGVGSMYVEQGEQSSPLPEASAESQQAVLPFAEYAAPTPPYPSLSSQNSKVVRNDTNELLAKVMEKPQRKVTEIRVYYDDQTWESFKPAK